MIDDPEPTLVDPGPSTTLEALRSGLAEFGLSITDLRHVLLTHVHLDHAGVSGHLLAENPKLTVHVHRDGAPHMAEPERLVASTRRTFGEAHDELWGEVLPVPPGAIRTWMDGEGAPLTGIRAFPTPGHIGHHVSYLVERSGVFLAGDALGIVLARGGPTYPPTPPPSLDVDAWVSTLEGLADLDPELLGVAHAGLHENFNERREEVLREILALEARVERALAGNDLSDRAVFEDEVRARLAEFRERAEIDQYFKTFSAVTDWDGMRFYLERVKPGRA
ncbi:MAG: MBL fold metallo-hydrolase [Gemmatimonadota bacterium]|nr:MAG: MBL fold metallo-hydrolase [Gemmatimonadota bacterium]